MAKNDPNLPESMAKNDHLGNVEEHDHAIDYIINKWDPFQDKMKILLKACGEDRNKGMYNLLLFLYYENIDETLN